MVVLAPLHMCDFAFLCLFTSFNKRGTQNTIHPLNLTKLSALLCIMYGFRADILQETLQHVSIKNFLLGCPNGQNVIVRRTPVHWHYFFTVKHVMLGQTFTDSMMFFSFKIDN